ncbi:MAG: MMPL family transporter, partial [Limisphaerales bacterium]
GRLRFDVEVFDLLPPGLPAVQGLKLYQENFANARELMIAVRAPDAEAAENAARTLAEHLRPASNLVAGVTWEPPWLEHPEQAAELIAYLWFNQPPRVFAELTNRLAPARLSELLKTTREELATSLSPQEIARMSYDPFGITRLPETTAGAAPSFAQGQEMFSSADGSFRILFVQAREELRTYHQCAAWLEKVKSIASEALSSRPELSKVRLGYTGRPAFYSEVALGMQHDITTSVGGTAAIIAVLFWLAHRRVKPMLWLLALLGIILGSTLALGGLFYGTINVVSMGFAAILLGLAVDYAVVHYQEALTHPHLSVPQIRHAIAPSILWAAVTTVAAFLVLNFGGLPGLGQLGTLVGLGVALAALIMIFEYLPPLFPGRNEPQQSPPELATGGGGSPEPSRTTLKAPVLRTWAAFGVTALLVLLIGVVLMFGLPKVDTTANALRPRGSQAYATLDEVQSELSRKTEPLWLIVRGADVAALGPRLEQIQATLARAVSNGVLTGFTLPSVLWPRPEFQSANRQTAAQLSGELQTLRAAAEANGFAPSSMGLSERVLDTWARASASTGVFWPTNPMSQWILDKVTARSATNCFALGLVNPATDVRGQGIVSALSGLESELPRENVWLSGWPLLGHGIFSRVKANFWKVLVPMMALVILSLYFAFRRLKEILLSVAVLSLSGLCLLSVMRVAGWNWNLLN